jgi:uroporphyrinogen-III synthase
MSGTEKLQGRRIVITRPEERAAGLARRLRELGAEPVEFPTIRLEPADPAALDDAIEALSEYDWLVFTSRAGVEAFFARLDAVGRPTALEVAVRARPSQAGVSSLGVAAIGPATAAALRERGVEPALVPREYVAEALLAALGEVRGMRFLLPRADLARQTLAAGLRARGAQVDEIAAYRTVTLDGPAPDLSGVDAVTFTSSSTVRGFVASGASVGEARVVCIGPVTAETARELGMRVDRVATEYTEEGLIEALKGVFST